MLTKMQKWGNSYAVRMPKAVIQKTGFHEGETLEVEVVNRQIRLRRSVRRGYTLRELLAGIRKENLHEEADFGEPEGRETL